MTVLCGSWPPVLKRHCPLSCLGQMLTHTPRRADNDKGPGSDGMPLNDGPTNSTSLRRAHSAV